MIPIFSHRVNELGIFIDMLDAVLCHADVA